MGQRRMEKEGKWDWEVGRRERKKISTNICMVTVEIHVELSLLFISYNIVHVAPLLNIPGNGRCGEHMEGCCVSNNTNRILINFSGYNKTEAFYPNTNTSPNIGPFEVSHSPGSHKILIKWVNGPETNGHTISCRDINGGLCTGTCI